MSVAAHSQKTYTERLEQLIGVARSLATTHDPISLNQTIMAAACELVGSQAAALVLFDRASNTLQLRAASWAPRDEPPAITLLPGRSLAGMVYNGETPVAFARGDLQQRSYDELSLTPGFEIESMLGAPLMVKYVCIGVLEVFNKVGDARFGPDDASALRTLAEQAAISLENTRIFSVLKETSTRLASLDRTQSDFLAVASHELSTPLQHIIAQANFMRDAADGNLGEQIDDLLAYAGRLEHVVHEVVNLANIEGGHIALTLEDFTLADLVGEVEAGAAEEARAKNVTLTITLPEAPVTLHADREKIRMVLAHLVDNAIKFSPRDDEVQLSVLRAHEQARFTVSNNGPPIAPEQMPLIFDRFYQAEDSLSRQHEGIGLGLPIARGIVEVHGGRIWAESTPDHGTHLTFVLPLVTEAPAITQKHVTLHSGASTSAPSEPLHAAPADDPDYVESEKRIRKLLREVGRVVPEMLNPMAKPDAERHLARFAMRHPNNAYLLSDYSLVRGNVIRQPVTADKSDDGSQTRVPADNPGEIENDSGTLPPVSSSVSDSDSLPVLPPRLDPDLDEEQESADRRRVRVALIALVILSMAACLFSLYAITTQTGRDLVAQVVATATESTATPTEAAATASATAAPTDAPTATQTLAPTATAPPAEATSTALAQAAEVSPAPVVLTIDMLAPENSYSNCMPVNSVAGNQLGQACMSIATGYTDENGALDSVDGAPAIVGVWLRLDSLAGAASELIGITPDPTSAALPPGQWVAALPGTELNLAVGPWSAQATINAVETVPFPSAPDSTPVLVTLDVEFIVASTSN